MRRQLKELNKTDSGIKKVSKKLANYLIILAVVLLFATMLRNINRVRRINLQVKEEEERASELKKENEELDKRLREAQSYESIEKQLRDNLGMQKIGEIVVILPDPEIVRSFAPKIEEEEEVLPDPNWKKWVKLFM